MEKNVKNILEELYLIDPSLREKEEELKKIIKTMIEIKPNVEIDENFKESLRNKILEKVVSKKIENYNSRGKTNLFHIFSYIFGAVGSLALVFTLIYNYNSGRIGEDNLNTELTQNYSSEKMLSFGNNIIRQEEGSFGNLSGLGIDATAKGGMGGGGAMSETTLVAPVPESESTLKSTNDGITPMSDAKEESISNTDDTSVSGAQSDSIENNARTIDPYFQPEVYTYTFSGELNLELREKMPVYKKESSKVSSSNLVNNIKNINFNGVDLSNFQNLNLASLSINEDTNYGYNINLDFENASLNMYKNWTKWPQIDYSQPQNPILLEEGEVKKIASDFLKKYNINLSNYGTPVIEENYANMLARADSKILPGYFGNTTSVIYPLIIDGKEISEEYGQLKGVRIEVDLKEKKVIGFNGLDVKDYIASDYNIETKKENIVKIASVGGRFGLNNVEIENSKYIEKKLINPKLVYVSTYNYKNGVNEEFIIPAIVFEVEKDENMENFYVEKVTVPLVKDFYKYDGNGNISGTQE